LFKPIYIYVDLHYCICIVLYLKIGFYTPANESLRYLSAEIKSVKSVHLFIYIHMSQYLQY